MEVPTVEVPAEWPRDQIAAFLAARRNAQARPPPVQARMRAQAMARALPPLAGS
jgi:hypothetical protein